VEEVEEDSWNECECECECLPDSDEILPEKVVAPEEPG